MKIIKSNDSIEIIIKNNKLNTTNKFNCIYMPLIRFKYTFKHDSMITYKYEACLYLYLYYQIINTWFNLTPSNVLDLKI